MEFNAKKVKEDVVGWIRGWFEVNGKGCNAIVGISGGKDSSVVAALCVEALGRERVIGVLMPNGSQHDIDMSQLLVKHLGIENYTVNIHDGYEGLLASVKSELGEVSRDTTINLAPRLRMATLYAVAQSRNGRVANTCNLSEDWVGYSTRYGDNAGDFSPLSLLCVREVRSGVSLAFLRYWWTRCPSTACADRPMRKSWALPMTRLMPTSATASCRKRRPRSALTACMPSIASRCAIWTYSLTA